MVGGTVMNKDLVGVKIRKAKNLLDQFEKTGVKDLWGEACEVLDTIEARKLLSTVEGKPHRERYDKVRRRAQRLTPR